MQNSLKPCRCPRCGNGSNEKGISYAYLEWRTCAVVGVVEGTVIAELQNIEGSNVTASDNLTAENIPKEFPDLAHLHCNKCKWNWAESDVESS